VTKPVTIMDVPLGRFRIAFSLASVKEHDPAFQTFTIPLDPNHAKAEEDDDELTPHPHPHVDGVRPCLGDVQNAVYVALHQGRFFDAAVMVDRLLHNYRRSTAYWPIEDWDGKASGPYCHDCDEETDTDNTCGGADCERYVCDNCTQKCAACEGDYLCSVCAEAQLHTCSDCGDLYCGGCRVKHLDDATRFRCESCHEAYEEDQAEERREAEEAAREAAEAAATPPEDPADAPS
jgi:hypothetical protein